MTEQEYINVRELSQVVAAREMLRGIVPANSRVISSDELKEVGEILGRWQDELFKLIKTE